MPGEEGHRGAEAPGFNTTRGDARVDRITDLLLEADPIGQSAHRPIRDHNRALQLLQQRSSRSNPITLGVVLHAVPHINWYKVQMSDGGGWLGCCRASDSNCIPMGPRVGNPIGPGSRVLVWKHTNIDFGVILCAIPHALEDPKVAVPGWLTQGSAVGLKREGSHRQLFQGMFKDGGVQDFSCQSPIDATSMDKIWVTETGLLFLMSPFEIMLRVNEMCGLFLNYFDSQTALAGWNLLLTSAAHEVYSGQDEGEVRYREMTSVYPWEAVGLYAPGSDIAQDQSDESVHYSGHKGKIDLAGGDEDLQPAYRVQEFRGYEGQGGLRAVVRPAGTSGKRHTADVTPDIGLFAESIGLDGEYAVQSAKSLFFIKRAKMPWPKEIKTPEDATGDDATADNYKFSSMFGSGADHKIGDIEVEGTVKHLRKVAGIQDVIAHIVNWKRLHPFHYRADYFTPQESQDQTFERVSDMLDFDEVKQGGYMLEPTPVFLNIDHRYGNVAYYLRESFLGLLDTGDVVLAGGSGERFVMTGGKIRMDCPGDLEINPARNVIINAAGCVIKMQDSVDISSSRKDVRIWAHENLQIGSKGSLLIDGQGTSREQNYRDRVGEDVDAGGVTIRSKGDLALLGNSIYERSLAGDIVLDANKLDGRVLMVASGVDAILNDALTIWHFAGIDGEALASHQFNRGASHHQGSLVVGGSAYIGVMDRGNLTVIGTVRVTRGIGCGGRIADNRGGTLGRVEDTFVSETEQITQPLRENILATNNDGDTRKNNALDNGWYAEFMIGNDEVLDDIGFSYRDSDTAGAQYGTRELKFLESRWQTFARLGGGTGGESWEENPISYQGRQLYPWPGRAKWTGTDSFVRVEELTMYDAAAGCDRDRPDPYEEAELSSAESVSMAEGVKVITIE